MRQSKLTTIARQPPPATRTRPFRRHHRHRPAALALRAPALPQPPYQIPPEYPHDPNNIIGPAGFGSGNFVTTSQTLPYQIDFENEPTAGLPAQQVTITQQLDSNLNWQSFRLGSFGFGGTTYTVPANTAFYQTQIDLTATDGYYVDVTATIDERTGIATWTFTTIDPDDGPDPARSDDRIPAPG